MNIKLWKLIQKYADTNANIRHCMISQINTNNEKELEGIRKFQRKEAEKLKKLEDKIWNSN